MDSKFTVTVSGPGADATLLAALIWARLDASLGAGITLQFEDAYERVDEAYARILTTPITGVVKIVAVREQSR